jgi:hypothetical protein
MGAVMKRTAAVSVFLLSVLLIAPASEAARVRVRHTGRRTTVTVHSGFPIRRTLPAVYVRAPRVAVRVTPRVFLAPVVFGAAVVSTPSSAARIWSEDAQLDREDGWTELTMNVDQRGRQLLLEIDNGAAQVSFAEVVFDNGEAQVVDFNDSTHRRGTYSLLDFRDGRKIDHVRLVAKADTGESRIALHLVK